MKTFKFLHLSDLHLDSPFANIGGVSTPREVNLLKSAQVEALSNAFKFAVNEECKFILIAGDIFDTKYSSIDTQFSVTELLNMLIASDIKLYLLLGNHDSDKIDFLSRFKNVFVFPTDQVIEVSHFDEGIEIAQIIGSSYQGTNKEFINSALKQRRSERLSNSNSLNDIVQIGIFHANTRSANSRTNSIETKSSPIDYTYNELDIGLLAENSLTYVALGHLHKYQVIHDSKPLICYSGAIQGRSLKPSECGEKGGVLVSVNNSYTSHKFLPFSNFQFIRQEIVIRESISIPELQERIIQELELTILMPVVLRLTLKLEQDTYSNISRFGEQESLISSLRIALNTRNIFLESIDFSIVNISNGALQAELHKEILLELEELKNDPEIIKELLSAELLLDQLDHTLDLEELYTNSRERLISII